MGYPASGFESLIRNNLKDVQWFLEKNYPGHYKVYSLCKEKEYKNSHFSNFTRKFAFEDHHVP